jgi:MoaA/NifB/PqqE/SkfB family radical SAM enzyme
VTEQPWINPEGQRMRRLELHLTYYCPERCVFCSEEHRMDRYKPYPVTWGRVATVLRTMAERGVDSVHLTGGEPTIHPKFIQVCALAKKLGMRTSVGTIGTMLSRPEFAARALPVLDEALFSLHGPDAQTHDALAGRIGSFDRVTQAIRTCLELKPGFGAFVNTVVTRQNIDVLPETIAFADSLGAKLIVVSNTTPEGGGYDHYEELAVPLEQLARVLPVAAVRAKSAVVRFFAVPLCILGDSWTLSNDLHWDPRVTVEWQDRPGKVVFEGIYSWDPGRKRIQVDACETCDRRGICFGVFERYVELWGAQALNPIIRTLPKDATLIP